MIELMTRLAEHNCSWCDIKSC